jgi:hypothetical protein
VIEGTGASGYENERMLLKRYLSDEIAPMIFSDSAAELFEVPVQIVVEEIQSWLGDQIRGASTMSTSELIHHAATKIHQLGVLELIPQEDVSAYLAKLRPSLLQICPAEQRRSLEENFTLLEKSTGMGGSKIGVVHRQASGPAPGGHGGVAGGHGGAPGGGGGGAPQAVYAGSGGASAGGAPGTTDGSGAGPAAADALALHRVNLMLDHLQRVATQQSSSPGSTPAVNQKAVLGHVVEQFASQAGSSKELETQLDFLQDIGVENLSSNLIEHLSEGLPDWAPPSHDEVGDKDLPAGATRAMRKVVKLSKDSEEVLARFRELLGVAINEFNTGSLGRAVTMLDLAERMVAQGEVDETIATTVIRGSYPELEVDLVHELADDPDKRLLLRRVLKFFPKLQAGTLFEELKTTTDREERLRLIKLLRAHGDEARGMAVEHLEESLNSEPRQSPHVERNFVYLMRAIPRGRDDDVEREIDLLIRVSDLTGSPTVVREAIGSLVQFESPRAYTTLAARISEIEDILLGETVMSFDVKEIRWLLSNAVKLLSQSESDDARSIVVSHGLRDKAALGDTYARLVPLGEHDLSTTPEQLNRLLDAIQDELPRKFLGVSVKNQRKAQILEYLISAVSGTNSPEVHTVLGDIVQQFSGQKFAISAETALTKLGQPVAKEKPKPPVANDAVTLSGDLALFGLPNVLQNLSDSCVTGAVKVIGSGGEEMAEIRLADGNVVAATTGKLINDIAVYQLLERPITGRFNFVAADSEEGDSTSPAESMAMMSLLLEGMRRFDEFARALSLIPDGARFKPTDKKPTDVKEDPNAKLAKAVWSQAARGVPPEVCEGELEVDCYQVRRLYEHWVTEGSLAATDPPPAAQTEG